MAKRMTPLKLMKGTPLKRLNYTTSQTRELMGEFDALKTEFGANKFENLYANIMNPYANMTNVFADTENVFEEGQIAMKGYDLQRQNLQEGLATTLGGMKESSNLDVQSIANALTKQGAQISANIEQQETQNLNLARQEESRLQTIERQEESRLQTLRLQGEHATQMQIIKGAEDVRNLELQQQQALMTLVSGQISAGKTEDYKTKGWLSKLLNL